MSQVPKSFVKSNIDPKTAKTLVRGILKTRISDMEADVSEVKKTFVNYTRLSKRQVAIEASAFKAFGNCILASAWEGRTLYFHAILPSGPSDSNRPYHGVLQYSRYNARSNSQQIISVLDITTHSMERILERRSEVQLLLLLKEELTLEFVERISEYIGEFYNGKLVPGIPIDIKIPTTTGIACVIFEFEKLPVMTTWYAK